jgi:hypothetical protein
MADYFYDWHKAKQTFYRTQSIRNCPNQAWGVYIFDNFDVLKEGDTCTAETAHGIDYGGVGQYDYRIYWHLVVDEDGRYSVQREELGGYPSRLGNCWEQDFDSFNEALECFKSKVKNAYKDFSFYEAA